MTNKRQKQKYLPNKKEPMESQKRIGKLSLVSILE